MSPLKDIQLEIRGATAGVLVMSVPENIVAILNGTPLGGMGLFVNIPATTAGAPTLAVYVHADSTTAPTTASPMIGARTGMAAAGQYVVPFNTWKRGLCFNLVPGPSTTPLHSIVTAWIVDQYVAQDWQRDTEFT